MAQQYTFLNHENFMDFMFNCPYTVEMPVYAWYCGFSAFYVPQDSFFRNEHSMDRTLCTKTINNVMYQMSTEDIVNEYIATLVYEISFYEKALHEELDTICSKYNGSTLWRQSLLPYVYFFDREAYWGCNFPNKFISRIMYGYDRNVRKAEEYLRKYEEAGYLTTKESILNKRVIHLNTDTKVYRLFEAIREEYRKNKASVFGTIQYKSLHNRYQFQGIQHS